MQTCVKNTWYSMVAEFQLQLKGNQLKSSSEKETSPNSRFDKWKTQIENSSQATCKKADDKRETLACDRQGTLLKI